MARGDPGQDRVQVSIVILLVPVQSIYDTKYLHILYSHVERFFMP